MKAAVCPGCGAELVFKDPGAIVRVCDFCHSVVARGDLTYENLGKIGDVVDSRSPLAVDLAGTYAGQPFTLTGRVLLRHPAGGTWEEWYAHFADGRWGWLAEAQGRFYLMFERVCAAPAWELVAVGRSVRLEVGEFMVAEKAEAGYAGAAGEIPFKLTPGETYRYADLGAQSGWFATIDYSEDAPRVFVGVEVTLADLGVAGRAPAERPVATITARRVACPNCDGALDLVAPDATQRVGCPYCGTLLDVNQGNLVALKSIANDRPQPRIPLGKTGAVGGTTYTAIGYVVRSVEVDGERYPWEEWLLYEPAAGFRWLVLADGHWSFVEPVPPGEVDVRGAFARRRGRAFKLFQSGTARVDQVLGELYWKVEAGEETDVADFVAPPLMLSWERSRSAASEEVNWSLGTYVAPAEVDRAFGLAPGPSPTGVAPNQPWPHGGYAIVCAFLLVGAVVLGLAYGFLVPRTLAFTAAADFAPLAAPSGTQVWFSEPFQLGGGRNVVVELAEPRLSQAWFYAQGDLVNTDDGTVVDFGIELEYYDGEGDRSDDQFLSAVPAGAYALRLEAQWSQWNAAEQVQVTVTQGPLRVRDLAIAFGAILGGALLFWAARRSFEARRWRNSSIEGPTP
jgi:hypothetical protein